MTKLFQLDKRLANDTHLLLDEDNFLILLHKNATIPWIIIVPKTEALEVFDLPEDIQTSLAKIAKIMSEYFKEQFGSEKSNIAAIGNVVSQLHVHVIGRKIGDACWPDVVWGNDYENSPYSKKRLDVISKNIINLLTLDLRVNIS